MDVTVLNQAMLARASPWSSSVRHTCDLLRVKKNCVKVGLTSLSAWEISVGPLGGD